MSDDPNELRINKILVVDDEPDVELLIKQRMRRDIRDGNYEFVFARNGVEALEQLKEHKDIDMVLSDINMPEMDGLTLLGQIPSVDPNVRSVIISAYGDMQNIRSAMNRGAYDFVTKPIDFADLRVTIDRTLEHLKLLRTALLSRDKLVALESELTTANQMQQTILPKSFPSNDSYKIFADMVPARDVGGDFYDVLSQPEDNIGFAVADVSGKGIPAAMFMMSSRTLLRGAAIGESTPSNMMREVNNQLCENNETSMFVTVLLGILDPRTGKLSYVNGGHNPPIVCRAGGDVEVLPEIHGAALGIVPDMEFGSATIRLSPGDKLFLYTDGVTEAENATTEQFGMDRLCDLIRGHKDDDPETLTGAVFTAVSEFAAGEPQFDDITCLTVQWFGGNE